MAHIWTYLPLGGAMRVIIHSGDDIAHLRELDEKLWTVQSCPVSGLSIPEESLSLLDADVDGHIHVSEVLRTADWLCTVLKSPDVLLNNEQGLRVKDIKDEALLKVASEVAVDGVVTKERVDAVVAAVTVPAQSLPDKPYNDEFLAAFRACRTAYEDYFRLLRLSQAGVAVIPEETTVPGLSETEFMEVCQRVDAWDKEAADITKANADALAKAKAYYADLNKLVLLHRDYYTLLRNFISFEDFYTPSKWAIFQAGTLVIDQRACRLTMRVNDVSKHMAQAVASGMFLLYCECTSHTLNQKMNIVAAVTMGEIKHLKVGKNALFYDREGRDWDATIVQIVDNPISIHQAFLDPYRKLSQWISDLVNKTAKSKSEKTFSDITTNVQASADKPIEQTTADKPQPFDIAKFAGIFAALGMAVGYIGEFCSSLISGINDTPAWKTLLWVVGLLLIISGPSMIIAWLKLRKRDIAPLLNANGWAINAEAVVSVLFGATLTTQSHFPVLTLDANALKKANKRKTMIIVVTIVVLLAVAAGLLWYFGILDAWMNACC